MSLKKFEEFVAAGFAKKQTPNRERAKSLAEEAANKHKFLNIAIKSIPNEKMNANFIIESCYDILMELIRAKMFIDGFNSKNSHEAEIAYTEKLGFSEAEMRFMDELRYSRNGIKYYGRTFDAEYSKKSLEFLEKTIPKLIKILSLK
ncbi:MAG TPA: hypothetical protein VJI97_00130 [Candidatus Nanoarchaeia archaeon]|nr:hypothetical protein [Candidatus Nanoarchaeia archaeon]